jgi:hypothetical protein
VRLPLERRLRFVLINPLGRVIRQARATLLQSYFALHRHRLDAARTPIHRPLPTLSPE